MCNMDHRGFDEQPDPRKIAETLRTTANNMRDILAGMEGMILNSEDRQRVELAKQTVEEVRSLDSHLDGMKMADLTLLARKLFDRSLSVTNILQQSMNLSRGDSR